MALETGTYISDLTATNPTSSDPKSQGDDHIRLLKSTIKASFPNINGAMTSSDEELNIMDGATLSTAELNILDGVTASTAEINLLDGVTATTTEINYIDGVTSSIQTQFDLKAPLASPTFTGVPAAPTAAAGSSGTQLATLDFVNATGFASSLPGQTGNAGKILGTDGTNASWGTSLNVAVVSPSAGTAFATTTATQTLTGKTLTDLILANAADVTKRANLILSGITAGQNRNITVSDENMTLFTPAMRHLLTVTASNSATVDLENVFDDTYDTYLVVGDGITVQTTGALSIRFKIAGSYASSNYVYSMYGAATVAGSNVADSISNASAITATFSMWLENPEATTKYHSVHFAGTNYGGATTTGVTFGAFNSHVGNSGLGALTGLRFLMASGNIVTGTFRVYGIRKTS